LRYALVKVANSDRWYIQWFERGHSRRASTGTPDRAQAEAVLAAFRLEKAARPEGSPTVPEILEWYLATKTLQSSETAKLAAKRLSAFFGVTPAVECGPALQSQYIEHRRKTVKDSTIQRDLTVLSAAIRLAVKHEKLPSAPPFLSLTEDDARDRWLTRAEVARIFWRLRRTPHLLLFARLALYTGARTGAILDLTWDRVDLVRNVVQLAKPGRRQTSKRRPPVPIDAPLPRALIAAKRRAKTNHVIEYRGKPVKRIGRGFRRHMQAIGLDDVTPHVFRHTFATWAARAGEPLHAIGGVLGQSVTRTTERYAKHQPEALRKVTRAVRRK
jgi:integrase